MKQCIACKRMLPKEDFRLERNVCKNCVSLQRYNPEEFQKKYPNYPGRKKIYGYNEKYNLKYKPPPPPTDIIVSMNALDNTISQILTEIKQMKYLMKDLLYNNR